MKIEKVEVYPIPLTLREPYVIAYHTVTAVTNVGITLHTSDGTTAVGIAGPEEEVTGETAETVLKAAKEIIEPFLHGQKIDDIRTTIAELDKLLGEQRAALALVDTALFDCAAKSAGVPLYKYLGAKRNKLATAITIYIHSPEETLRRVKKLLDAGYKIVKIKGGLDLAEDLHKLKLIRGSCGKDLPIIFDVNQGYSIEQFEQFQHAAKDLNLLCIEQPIHKQERAALCTFAQKKLIPIMADESIVTADDAEFLGEKGIQYFNLKLMKSGGINATQEMDKIATRHHIKVITSCMDEAALANYFGLAFSLASPNVDFVDLDSFTDYTVDPTRHYISFENGYLVQND